MPLSPDEVFAPLAHDLEVCGLTSRLLHGAPGVQNPDAWRVLVVSGVKVGTLEFDEELSTETPGMALWPVAFFTQAAILENAQLLSGAVWPTCQTGHRHPMELSQEGEHDWPAWSCPKNPAYRCPVGQHPGP